MTREQLDQIKEIYDLMNKGLTNPLKINAAYKHINPNFSSEPPTRAKINAINRFMMLNFRDEWDAMIAVEKQFVDIVETTIPEDNKSVGTTENKADQSHSEEILENRSFLTATDKASLAGEPLTVLEVPARKRRRKK